MGRNSIKSLMKKPIIDFSMETCYPITRGTNMKQTLTIRLPNDLRQELIKISKSENKPISDLELVAVFNLYFSVVQAV